MNIRKIFLFILLLPTASYAQTPQSDILFYIPTIITATSNSADNNNFSVGTARSTDIGYININNKFNSWLITQIGAERQEILLIVKEVLGEFNAPAKWALAIRTQPDPIGTILAEDVEIKLFSNYTSNTELCCVNTRPFSDFDQADASYLGVSGSIDFVSNKSGTFQIGFQKEDELGSGKTSGKIVIVEGCWSISGEDGVSGCNL